MKKTLAILLAAAMLLAMTACGGQTAQTPVASESSEAIVSEVASAPVETPEEPAEPSAAEEEPAPAQFVEVELPICQEETTFSIWYTWPPVLSNFCDGPGSSPMIQELEARTNVKLDYHLINTEAASEEFSLMAASGDYLDLIVGGTSYYTNPEQIIDDGIAVDVAPYLDTLMPNLKAVLDSNEAYKLAAYTDSGCIAECYRFEIGTDQNVGPVIRKDWLDQLGLEIPTTYEDYREVLTAFKNQLNVSAPLLIPYTGLTNYYSLGYGIPCDLQQELFYVKDGQVTYSGLEQDYYDFLTLMSQWYAEGLIDPDFLTRTTTTDPDFGLITGDNAGVWTANALMFDMYSSSANDSNFAITGIGYPQKAGENTGMYLNEAQATGVGYVVTTACHDLDTCLRYIDYWYSEEGTFLANYGIEDLTFVYENGEAHLTELILASEIGLPSSLTSSIYITNAGPYIEDCTRNQYFFGELQKTALENWDRSDWDAVSEAYPGDAQLTTEEAEEYTSIMSDINTYMEETVSSVLVGNDPISVLDEMAEKLNQMNIGDAIALKQAAYDRYMSKAA